MWIIKLGGSLMRRPALAGWLRALRAGGGQIIVVPGGGIYADQVRTAQARIGFSDTEAHTRALYAMHRYGALLTRRNHGLKQTATCAGLRRILRAGRTPLWSPVRMVPTWRALPHDWRTTSDSLALYLASLLNADCLILAKCPQPRHVLPSDLVDQYFPVLWAKQRYRPPVYWLGEHGHAALRLALHASMPPGRRLNVSLRNADVCTHP